MGIIDQIKKVLFPRRGKKKNSTKAGELICPGSSEMHELLKALGLPKHTLEFALRGSLDNLLTMECTYRPDNLELDGNKVKTIFEKFELRKVGEYELQEVDKTTGEEFYARIE